MDVLTQAEFAKTVGVSRQAVSKAVANGRVPSDETGRVVLNEGTAKDLWDLTASPAPHHQAIKDRLDEARQGVDKGVGKGVGIETPPATGQAAPHAPRPPSGMPSIEKLASALKIETYKLQKAKAELANIEVDKAAGALVERSETEFVLADLGAQVRSQLEGLPDRIAGQIAAHRGDTAAIHADLDEAIHAILTELAAAITKKTGSK